MAPTWQQLLRGQQLHGRTALTIPFLLGAARDPSNSTDVSFESTTSEISGLLRSFCEDAPASYAVSLYRCPDINQPVALYFFSAYTNSEYRAFRSVSQKRRTLFVDPTLPAGINPVSIGELSTRLARELHPVISEERFSFRGGEYIAFTSADFEFIQFCLEAVPDGGS